jgi:hypothetical protein
LDQKESDSVIFIKLGYDIALGLPAATTIVYVLHIHPSRTSDLVTPENFRIEPGLPVEEYLDGFGNRCGRVNAPAGNIRFLSEAVIRDSGELDSRACSTGSTTFMAACTATSGSPGTP